MEGGITKGLSFTENGDCVHIYIYVYITGKVLPKMEMGILVVKTLNSTPCIVPFKEFYSSNGDSGS